MIYDAHFLTSVRRQNPHPAQANSSSALTEYEFRPITNQLSHRDVGVTTGPWIAVISGRKHNESVNANNLLDCSNCHLQILGETFSVVVL